MTTGDVVGCLGARRPPFRMNETVRHTTSVTLKRAVRAPCFRVAEFIHNVIHRTVKLSATRQCEAPGCIAVTPSPCERRPAGGFDDLTVGALLLAVNATCHNPVDSLVGGVGTVGRVSVETAGRSCG